MSISLRQDVITNEEKDFDMTGFFATADMSSLFREHLFLAVVLLLFLPAVNSDIPRCHKDNPDFTKSPYCLPYDYNKDIVPPTHGEPLYINVDIFVFEVSKIDDIALSMTFELYFDLTWKETRLEF